MWTRTKHVPPPEVLFPGSKHCYCAPQEFTCSASNAGHPRFLKASESWTKKRQSTDKMSGDFLVMTLRALNSIDRGLFRPTGGDLQPGCSTNAIQATPPGHGQVAMFHSKLFVYPREMGISAKASLHTPENDSLQAPPHFQHQGLTSDTAYLLAAQPFSQKHLRYLGSR